MRRWSGGDFWDIFAYDNGHVALVIGDVMGHGLTAAVFTAEIRFILRAFLREHERPGFVLDNLNAYLNESHRLYREGLNDEGDEAPVCLALAVVHTASGAGVVASAGMEPPLLLRAGGGIEQVAVSGLLLGVETDQEYQAVAVPPGTRGHTADDDGRDHGSAARQGVPRRCDGLARLAREAQPLGTLEAAAQSHPGGGAGVRRRGASATTCASLWRDACDGGRPVQRGASTVAGECETISASGVR